MPANIFQDTGNPAQREFVISKIKAKAASHIGGIIGPEHRQMNMLARNAELLEKSISRGGLTASEVAETVAMKLAWSKVKAIRHWSNALESAFLAGQTVDISAGWPE